MAPTTFIVHLIGKLSHLWKQIKLVGFGLQVAQKKQIENITLSSR